MTHFDFIVIGAGSAGCVVASRLSEDRSTRVLLLEAGGSDRRVHIRVPLAFTKLFKSAMDWHYTTEPQAHLEGRRLYWPRGKVLGGCSSINAMIYIRGHRHDYDHWAELGNQGWSYAEVLPYFKRAENNQHGASVYHGQGGAVDVSDLRYPNLLSTTFIQACTEVGIPRNQDFNGARQEGAGFYQVTQKRGHRVTTAQAYLKPARQRPHLQILTAAQATRILFEGTRAVGVEYQHQQARHQVSAGEIILCGGAINSPHLLLLSGVGPHEQLTSKGIPVVADLPGVGQNLQDHPLVGVCQRCTQPITLDQAENLVNILHLVFFRSGPLTSNAAEAGAFVRSTPEIPVPDLQIHFVPGFYIEHGLVRPRGFGFSIGMCILRPHSRGEITLHSADPLAPPCIQPRYLEESEDLRLLISSVRLARSIARTSAFAPYRGEEHLPGKNYDDEEETLARYIRRNLETLYHPVGTCKMGSDPRAVVDAQLRVHGISGLRIVDASIMPTLVGGNTNAPSIMIGEKGADLIRGMTPLKEMDA